MSLLWDGVREGCGSCEFWLPHSSPSDFGTCKRYPPTMVAVEQRNRHGGPNWVDVEQHLPTMAKPDWCGEWKRKQGAPCEA